MMVTDCLITLVRHDHPKALIWLEYGIPKKEKRIRRARWVELIFRLSRLRPIEVSWCDEEEPLVNPSFEELKRLMKLRYACIETQGGTFVSCWDSECMDFEVWDMELLKTVTELAEELDLGLSVTGIRDPDIAHGNLKEELKEKIAELKEVVWVPEYVFDSDDDLPF